MVGLLLANTGSPSAPTPAALRSYLAQFLSDRRVIDLPRWLWLPLLHGIILNVRPLRKALDYRRIWTPDGSPLLRISKQLSSALETELNDRVGAPFPVVLGMRYGEPSIASGLRALRQAGCEALVVLPVFPQYCSATTASIFDAVMDELRTWRRQPGLNLIDSYYDHPRYVQAVQDSLRAAWQSDGPPERLLFSFHGIPQSYADRGDPYPQHCVRTAEAVTAGLGLDTAAWEVVYQSRFGPQAWLQPYTEPRLAEHGARNLSRLDLVCPGFAIDCLETLDEIDREGRETYQAAGGGEFRYIPALNASPSHVTALAHIVTDRLCSSYSTSPYVQ